MAYKQKGCSPVTAKIKRTTKGGMITQPLLNMGAPVKMKGDLNKDGKMSGYESKRQAAIEKSMSSPAKQTGINNFVTDYVDPAKKKAKENLVKKKPKRIAGGGVLSNKEYNKREKASEGITGKTGSDLRRKQYDAKGWAYDDTIKKPKAKTISTNTRGTKAEDIVKSGKNIGKEKKNVANGPSDKIITKPKAKVVTKKAVKNIKAANNKEDRAAKVRQKGIDALASGNKQKALRLKRREDRIKKRAEKKRAKANG